MHLDSLRAHLLAGQVIPAHPLALDDAGRFDERHQRALTRYYVSAGAGGIAVGVHTTQFAIRERGLLEPVLTLAAETAGEMYSRGSPQVSSPGFVLVAGLVGDTRQAAAEARLARDLGYDAGLLSLAAWRDASEDALLAHCVEIATVIPLFAFYLQPAVGGRDLGHAFWRRLADEVPSLAAVKVAPFDRYATFDVVRAFAEANRPEVALYTGNDDNIVVDLLTPYRVMVNGQVVERRISGGLLGQWAVWTRRAVEMLDAAKKARGDALLDPNWLARAASLTDANGAIFDARHRFAGCIPGIHEVLRRQGLLASARTLDPAETLSPGQAEEIDRVTRSYPSLTDDEFVREYLEAWLA